jgi:hypothetical protein
MEMVGVVLAVAAAKVGEGLLRDWVSLTSKDILIIDIHVVISPK